MVSTEIWSQFKVPTNGDFSVADFPHLPDDPALLDKETNKKLLRSAVESISKLQRKLYADNRYSLLLVFQAMDAGGKDGTIRRLLSGVNPAGCHVVSFKAPSKNELARDFLWRIHKEVPRRGCIGVFNRSHYEEVLVVRVHPGFLQSQHLPRLPSKAELDKVFQARLHHIAAFEKHLADQGTIIIKFWLNVSRKEQHSRFKDRIDEEKSRWKFNMRDIQESERWDDYMKAYQAALSATSKPWAPWYAIPADNKPFMRRAVGEIVESTIANLDIRFPTPSQDDLAAMVEARKKLLV